MGYSKSTSTSSTITRCRWEQRVNLFNLYTPISSTTKKDCSGSWYNGIVVFRLQAHTINGREYITMILYISIYIYIYSTYQLLKVNNMIKKNMGAWTWYGYTQNVILNTLQTLAHPTCFAMQFFWAPTLLCSCHIARYMAMVIGEPREEGLADVMWMQQFVKPFGSVGDMCILKYSHVGSKRAHEWAVLKMDAGIADDAKNSSNFDFKTSVLQGSVGFVRMTKWLGSAFFFALLSSIGFVYL